MSNNNIVDVKYSRLIQKNGNTENMPSLISGEIGFMNDSARAFIGTDPSVSTSTSYNRVVISPFMNARKTVQSYLDESNDFTSFVVRRDMTIDTGSNDMAVELADYLNTVHRQNMIDVSTGQFQPIARVDSNVEFVTNKNIDQYAQPSDFNVKYGPVDRINSHADKMLYQLLDSTKGDIFLEYQYQNILYVNIEYVLIQDDGSHRRSGNMVVLCDNTFDMNGDVTFKDDPFILTDSTDKVEFNAQASNGIMTITFTQPDEHKTKIFYRLSRWNIEEYIHVNNYYEESYIGPLSVNDDLVLNTTNGDNS